MRYSSNTYNPNNYYDTPVLKCLYLGNVLAVITDRKLPVDDNGDNVIDYYQADITSTSDYSAFGVKLYNRGFSFDKYRYGFNGKENDDEVKGGGNSVDFGARIYDSRLGRWMSIDPLAHKYPDLSPYVFSANSPILLIDIDGRDFITYIKQKDQQTGKTVNYKVTFNGTEATIHKVGAAANTAVAYKAGTNQFVDDMVTSYNYIVENGADVDGAMQKMASSDKIHIQVKEIKGNEGTYDKGVIEYNFEFGAKVKNKKEKIDGYQSPAVGFWSEVYHAYIDKMDKQKKKELKGDVDKEEEFIHVEKEGAVIDKLKEKMPENKETKRTKYDDGGPGKKRSSPTSTEPKKKK